MKRNMNLAPKKVPLSKNLKRIIKSFRKYYLYILISFISISISVVLSILAPQWLKKLTDEITLGQASMNIDLDKVSSLAIVLIVFYVSNAILSFISGFIMNTINQKYCYDMREEISEKINKMPLSYFDRNAYGDTLSRVTNDVDQIGQSLQQSVTMLFQSVLMLVGVLIAMFITSYQMALTVLASIPLVIIMLMVIMKFAVPYFKLRQEQIGVVNGVVEENYSAHLIIKAFNAEEVKGKAFEEENEKLHKTMFKAQFFGGIMQPMMSFISYFAYAAVYLVGGLLMAYDKGISFGTITAFTVYVNLFQSPLSQIAQSMNSIQMASGAADRVFEFLDEKELEDEHDKKTLLDMNHIQGNIEFKDVKFGYFPDKIIIPSFNASVKSGMKVAIVGPTGAGKTTLVNLLMRFYELNSGDILIDGVSIKDMSRKEVRNIFGMVLQDTWLFEGTLRENIVFDSKNVTEEELNEIVEKSNLAHFVNTLPNGLDTKISEDNELSQGQKQLITIARAMAHNSPLLILDEATSNVDTRTEILVQEAMDEITKGRTSFVIAHRLSTIKNADLILVLKDGNIIEQGSHEELLNQNGFYASLYNSQFLLDSE